MEVSVSLKWLTQIKVVGKRRIHCEDNSGSCSFDNSCASTMPFAHGKVVLYDRKATVVCNLYSSVKLSTGNQYGYIKKDKRVIDNIPIATTYGLTMAFLTTRAVPPIRVKVYRVRWSSQVFTKA